MFQRTDFWIGLAVGVVAGAFGYKFIQSKAEKEALMMENGQEEVSMEELLRQKEALEDMIAANEAAAK